MHDDESIGAIALQVDVVQPVQMTGEFDRMATLKDVAAIAEVSIATVSRFFSRRASLAKTTADRIEHAVAATGYIPNVYAGALAGSRVSPGGPSGMVAVLVPTFSHSIFNDMIEAIATELNGAGINAMFGLTGTRGEHESEVINAAIGRRVDAIITSAPMIGRASALRRRGGMSIIEIWDLPESPIDVAIGFSHFNVGRTIANFLLKRGYRRPHLVTSDGSRAAMRRDGFIKAWSRRSTIAVSESRVDVPSRFGHGQPTFDIVSRIRPRPDVVVCASDLLAQGLIIQASAQGVRVPEDLAVVGFGDSNLAAEMRPTITSVHIDGRRIAKEVITVLKEREIGGVLKSLRIDVGFRLVARESA